MESTLVGLLVNRRAASFMPARGPIIAFFAVAPGRVKNVCVFKISIIPSSFQKILCTNTMKQNK